MPILDLCQKKVVTVEPSASLQYAAQLMKKHHVGGVVVVEGNGASKPIGILTDRDIVLSVVAENLPLGTRVQDAMSKDVIKVKQTEGIAAVVDSMEQQGVRRMIVVDDFGNTCGLVSSDDILQLVARELSGIGKLLQRQVENEGTYRRKHDAIMETI